MLPTRDPKALHAKSRPDSRPELGSDARNSWYASGRTAPIGATAKKSAANEIVAPRMFPLVSYGAGTKFSRRELDDPAMAPQEVKAVAANGNRVISMDPLGWSLERVGAMPTTAKASTINGERPDCISGRGD